MCLTVFSVRLSPTLSRRRSRTAAAAVLGLLAGLLAVLAPAVPVVSAPSAGASSAYLCTGYSRCADAGYSHAGYASRSNKMYWRMYSGHNCTNYVAYRMIQAGMSTERPWSGTGNAYNWGLARRDITDQKPAVGAVAWWNRNVPGAGSVGHVAYVEKVVSSTVIIVSQDSWGGDFSWKRIDKNDSGWPSGFIHFADKPTFENVTQPALGQTSPRVGLAVGVSRGTWSPRPGSWRYQWYSGGYAVPGATGARFTPRPQDVGRELTAQVWATRNGTEIAAKRTPAAVVQPGIQTLATPAEITGEVMMGGTLTLTPSTWTPGTVTQRQWLAEGEPIEGATGTTLALTRALIGKRIRVLETAEAQGYAVKRTMSNRSEPVLQGAITPAVEPTGTGEPHLGQTLTVDPGTTRPGITTLTYEWLRDGVAVPGATGTSYRLTAADVGSAVTARISRTRENFAPLTTEVAFPGLVGSDSRLSVLPYGRSQAAAVRIYVRARGVDAPDGRVTITVATRQVRGVVRDGFLRAFVRNVPPGLRRVVVDYAGTDVLTPARWTGTVRIAR